MPFYPASYQEAFTVSQPPTSGEVESLAITTAAGRGAKIVELTLRASQDDNEDEKQVAFYLNQIVPHENGGSIILGRGFVEDAGPEQTEALQTSYVVRTYPDASRPAVAIVTKP